MRSLLCALAFGVAASSAAAQVDDIANPFAPPRPAVFVIDEVHISTRTDVDGRDRTAARAFRHRLELRAGEGPYQAVWTTLSSEPLHADTPLDSTRLVGTPIEISLSQSGAPNDMKGWGALRELLQGSLSAEERDLLSGLRPEGAAALLAFPLTLTSACYGPAMPPQGPPEDSPLFSSRVASREIRSVDQSAGTAQVVFSYSTTFANREDGTTGGFSAMVLECLVDLRAGIVRLVTLTADGASSSREPPERERRTFTITRER